MASNTILPALRELEAYVTDVAKNKVSSNITKEYIEKLKNVETVDQLSSAVIEGEKLASNEYLDYTTRSQISQSFKRMSDAKSLMLNREIEDKMYQESYDVFNEQIKDVEFSVYGKKLVGNQIPSLVAGITDPRLKLQTLQSLTKDPLKPQTNYEVDPVSGQFLQTGFKIDSQGNIFDQKISPVVEKDGKMYVEEKPLSAFGVSTINKYKSGVINQEAKFRRDLSLFKAKEGIKLEVKDELDAMKLVNKEFVKHKVPKTVSFLTNQNGKKVLQNATVSYAGNRNDFLAQEDKYEVKINGKKVFDPRIRNSVLERYAQGVQESRSYEEVFIDDKGKFKQNEALAIKRDLEQDVSEQGELFRAYINENVEDGDLRNIVGQWKYTKEGIIDWFNNNKDDNERKKILTEHPILNQYYEDYKQLKKRKTEVDKLIKNRGKMDFLYNAPPNEAEAEDPILVPTEGRVLNYLLK